MKVVEKNMEAMGPSLDCGSGSGQRGASYPRGLRAGLKTGSLKQRTDYGHDAELLAALS